jgi:DNA helicase-2/ATP-dependent DNA helicase PcrA
MKIKKYPIVVYDLETTGLNILNDVILEIAAITINLDKEFHQYINTDKKIENSFIHNITNDFLDKNVTKNKKEILLEFLTFVNNCYKTTTGDIFLMAHNNFNFDKKILEIEFKNINVNIPDNWIFIDSLQHFKYILKNQSSYSLCNLYKHYFGETIKNQHNALYDVKNLITLYKHIIKDINEYDYQKMYYCVGFMQKSIFHIDFDDQKIELLSLGVTPTNNLKKNNIFTYLDILKKFRRFYDKDINNLKDSENEFIDFLKNCNIQSQFIIDKIINFVKHYNYFK